MEFGEMLISTGVDALIKLVREKGRVEITLASRLLNIPISTIEEWSHALEEEGIISIEYQLTKVYLKWVSPSQEQVAEERAELEEGRSQALQQIKEVDKKAEEQVRQAGELKTEFNASYSKIMQKMEELGKKSAAGQQAKTVGEEEYYKASDELASLRSSIGELRDSAAALREQLEKARSALTGSEVEAKMEKISESRKSSAALKSELEAMEKHVSKALESVSKSNVDVSGMREPVKEIRREFETLKGEMDAELGSLPHIAEASKMIAEARGTLTSLHESAAQISKELKESKGTISENEKTLARLAKKLEEEQDRLSAFKEALRDMEQTLSHLRIDSEAQKRIENLVERGKSLDAKMGKFQSMVEDTLPLFENVDNLISSLTELKKRISLERRKLAEESGAIFASLDEEAATYTTFQKIKEKALSSLADYSRQLEKIDVGYEKAEKEAAKLEKRLESALSGFRESREYKGAEELSSSMDALAEKRKLLDEVRAGIESLDASAAKTAKQVKLLAKEAELLELRASSSIPAEREAAKKAGEEMMETVALTETEQKDFDLKREELRKLIKKLWEEE